MAYSVSKVQVWAGDVLNRPGMLARVLEALRLAGAQLEFLVARRISEDTCRVFLSPLRSAAERRAAGDVGLVPAAGMHALRVEGPDRPGLGADLSRAIADAGINVRGASAAAIGRSTVFYLAFATAAELSAAMKVAQRSLRGPRRAGAARAAPRGAGRSAPRRHAQPGRRAAPTPKTRRGKSR